jgi:hypothetical protein
MHGHEKSDSAVVAMKPANKAERSAAEPVERRAGTEGKVSQHSTRRAQDRESVSQVLARIRQTASERKKERFTALFHHLSIAMLRTAFFALKRDAAPGIDGLAWRAYEADLDRRIEDLHGRLHRGAYRVLASRRRHIGFTFICGTSRQGGFLIKRKTRRDRMSAKLREIKDELRRRRHWPIPEQGQWLRQVVTGFFAYHAVPTNGAALSAFRYHVTDLWRRSLQRRSQRDRCTWKRMGKLVDAWLPQPRILHPWPQQRFAVKHPRWEPYAGVPHVRIYAGGAR